MARRQYIQIDAKQLPKDVHFVVTTKGTIEVAYGDVGEKAYKEGARYKRVTDKGVSYYYALFKSKY